jgi:hypothetical protein
MEEFGDWIYLIVIIIVGITSLISSTRKKARQLAEQNQPREIITDQSGEGDLWRELTQQAEKKPEVKIQPKRQAQPLKPPTKDYHTPFLNIYQEGQSSIEATEIQSAVDDEEYATLTVDDLPDNTDEWRKAFIYNEIFSRKN